MLKYGDKVVLSKDYDGFQIGTKGCVLYCPANDYDDRCYIEFEVRNPNGTHLGGLTNRGYGAVIPIECLEKVADSTGDYTPRILRDFVNRNGKIEDGQMRGFSFLCKLPEHYDFVYIPRSNTIGIVLNDFTQEYNSVIEVLGLQKNISWSSDEYFSVEWCSEKATLAFVLDKQDTTVTEKIKTLFNTGLKKRYEMAKAENNHFEYANFREFSHHSKQAGIDGLNTLNCDICGQEILNSTIFFHNGEAICEDCFVARYRRCNRCGNTFSREGVEHETLCPNCAKRDFILPYHQYQPTIEFFGDSKDNTVPFLGVELEVDGGGENDHNAKRVMGALNPKDKLFAYCSHDGSLHEGFEIITQPATLEYHTSIKDVYKRTFDMLKQYKYSSHDTTTCGLHVHFNRNFYEDNDELNVTKLLYLVDKFWDEMVKFSRRNYRSLDRFSKKIEREDIEHFVETVNRKGRRVDHDYHYYSVNLMNENTVEFRMFRGTLNVDTFIATLQFVHNCILAAKHNSAEQIQAMTFDELMNTRLLRKYWNRRNAIEDNEE